MLCLRINWLTTVTYSLYNNTNNTTYKTTKLHVTLTSAVS